MKKLRKRILAVVGILALVALVLLLVLVAALPSLATWAVNTRASRYVKADVSLDGIEIGWLKGQVTLEGLRVGQPEGFGETDLLTIRRAHVDVGLKTLFNPPIIIQSITVEGLNAHVVKNSNGVMNVQQLVDPPAPKAPPEPTAPGKLTAVELWRLALRDIALRYEDHALPGKPIDLRVVDLVLDGNGITFDPSAVDDETLPSDLHMIAALKQGKLQDARIGVAARLGVLGGAGVPAVNAVVRISGLELTALGPVVPMGVVEAMGGSCLDIYIDAAVAEDVLSTQARIRTQGNTFRVSVGGTPAEPTVRYGEAAMLVVSRMGGMVGRLGRNVGDAGMEVASTAVDTASATLKGAGNVVGSVGKGLWGTVKGAASGDMKAMGDGLRQTTVGTVGEAFGAATNMAATAAGGVGRAANAGVGRTGTTAWRADSAKRWETEWKGALESLNRMPFPKPEVLVDPVPGGAVAAKSKPETPPQPEAIPEEPEVDEKVEAEADADGEGADE